MWQKILSRQKIKVKVKTPVAESAAYSPIQPLSLEVV
jgi:hypothetical protein